MDEFFANETPPAHLASSTAAADDFVREHVAAGRRVVLVTSGGTTVPLEKNMVRFLDNFSTGGRGAASTEAFLDAGCAVIFLHRAQSLEPYLRHITRLPSLLDALSVISDGSLSLAAGPAAAVAVAQYQRARGRLLRVPFTTVVDYLFLLRALCVALGPAGSAALVYLAAAVSDFYLPAAATAEHKLPSSHGALHLTLQPVPKCLRAVAQAWCPAAFVVSFKLETDAALLAGKARAALHTAGHDVVVANLLQSRAVAVTLYFRSEPATGVEVARVADGPELEVPLVAALLAQHAAAES